MNKKIIENMKKHNYNLSEFACSDESAIRFESLEEDIRTPFFRDIDKVLYSLSYMRYIDKTQVFSNNSNDMISKRMTHVQLVSKIARTIGRALNLNEDLIEAAGLGHDLGHVPFGHQGEKILNDISLKHNEGYFNHNVQSVRILMELENSGKGNNITLQVLDAIFCHNGESLNLKYYPVSKTKEEFMNEYRQSYTDKEILKKVKPMTLEGCIVRISDIIAYIGKDVEDAMRIGLITENDIPNSVKEKLGSTNSDIVNSIVMDIISNSIDKNYIMLSQKIYDSVEELIKFNYQNIYNKANSKKELEGYETMFNSLFDLYYNAITTTNKECGIYTDFLNKMSDKYIQTTTISRKVIDYISGMTDDFFVAQFKKYCNNVK